MPPHSAAQPREASWSPSGVVASGTRGEHARWPICVADEPPRLAPDSLIERVGMPDLGRNRRAAMYTKGAKAAVAFCPKGTAPGRHRRTSLAFGYASMTRLPAIAPFADDGPTAWRIPRGTTLGPGARPAHVHAASFQVGAVESLDRRHRLRLRRHLDEAKTPRSAVRPVGRNGRGTHRAVGDERRTEIVFRHLERQVSDE